jgi:hypothetical protein
MKEFVYNGALIRQLEEEDMNRRGFIAAASGALAGGRQFAERVVETAGLGQVRDFSPRFTDGNESPPPSPPPQAHLDMDDPKVWARALLDSGLYRDIESLLYEEYRHVHAIPPELYVLKSFSPMAKLTFARQDIVRRQLESRAQHSVGGRLMERMYKWAGLPMPNWCR